MAVLRDGGGTQARARATRRARRRPRHRDHGRDGRGPPRGASRSQALRGDVWEVKAGYKGLAYRVLFAEEGDDGQVCLALELFSKKLHKTPPQTIAQRRLRDWRSRGRDSG